MGTHPHTLKSKHGKLSQQYQCQNEQPRTWKNIVTTVTLSAIIPLDVCPVNCICKRTSEISPAQGFTKGPAPIARHRQACALQGTVWRCVQNA